MRSGARRRTVATMASNVVFNTVVPGLGLALLLGAAVLPAVAVAAAATLAIAAVFALRQR
jgi:hypothetical protein